MDAHDGSILSFYDATQYAAVRGGVFPISADGDCATCHEPHAADGDGLLTGGTREACLACHDTDNAFRSAHQSYPVETAPCQQCHDPHASAREAMVQRQIEDRGVMDPAVLAALRADPDTGKTRSVLDTISDNAANAGIVLGKERHAIGAFDLRGRVVDDEGKLEGLLHIHDILRAGLK